MVKAREDWIDWAKAILIFLMVLGHNSISGWLARWIYGFHMPAFFIISGYLYKPKDWRKTLKSFLVPVAFYSVIRLAFYLAKQFAQGNSFPEQLLYRTIMPFWKAGVTDEITLFLGIWFINALIFCRLICGDIYQKLKRKYIYITAVFIILFMSFESFFDIPSFVRETYLYRSIPCLPYFVIGIYWKEHYSPPKSTKNLLLIILLVLLYSGIAFFNGYVEFAACIFGSHYLLTMINALLGSFLLFEFCKLFKPAKWVQVYAVGTILILGLHKIFFNILTMALPIKELNSYFLIPLLETMIIMLLCYYPIKFCVKKIPILLGK